jgi:hypothetical protein
MSKVPVGKPNSEAGPALVIAIIFVALIAIILSYFGINIFN